jgi:hypothetical protein
MGLRTAEQTRGPGLLMSRPQVTHVTGASAHQARRVRRVLVVATSSTCLLISAAGGILAQSETDSARAVRHAKVEGDLAKAAQNPVANMVSLPLQYNYYAGGGLGSTSQMVLNLQPVLPLEIGNDWLIVSRTIVPFTNVPFVPFTDVSLLRDTVRARGIADIQEQAFFTGAKPGKVTWGIGPVFSFPTATNNVLRTGQWGLGPTAVALVMPGPWVIGTLVNNLWRIGGAVHGTRLNTFTVQPFINLNLPHAWAISTSPLMTSNWSAPRGQRWTVPLGAGFSKVAHIGEQPMNFEIQYYRNAKRPRIAGSNGLRLEAAALWPTAAAQAAKKKEESESAAKKPPAKDGGKKQ